VTTTTRTVTAVVPVDNNPDEASNDGTDSANEDANESDEDDDDVNKG